MTAPQILCTGTLAIDHIAAVADGFSAGDLNGKLHTPQAHWGGCGMNLAYGLIRAGSHAVPWVFYGDDCPANYLKHIRAHNIDERVMVCQTRANCAAAYIFTRGDGSQLTGFYPGSTVFRPPNPSQAEAIGECTAWIAGPEDDATLLGRLAFIPSTSTLYWMPGQYTEVTRKNVLEPMLARRPNLIVNAKEWQTLLKTCGEQTLLESVEAVFITQGENGVEFRASAKDSFTQRPTNPASTIDPTGCGDAFSATLVANLCQGVNVANAIDHAQQIAGLCLSSAGSQNY